MKTKKWLSLFLSLVMLLGLLPALGGAATAATTGDPVSYIERGWDDNTKTVTEAEQTVSSYTVVESSSEAVTWGNGWYVVKENVTITERITITGSVSIILCDGCTLTASKGVNVSGSNTLNIYGQAAGSGSLTADADHFSNGAGIGNDGSGSGTSGSGGTVTIHGGSVTATGGICGAGIGGGSGRNGGIVTVYGGSVKATGGVSGAGIGGGGSGGSGTGGSGGTVNVYGGSVTATGGVRAAGIGGGYSGSGIGGAGAAVTVYGGSVTATGGNFGAGIGGGHGDDSGGDGAAVTVYGGSVKATGGDSGAGIGGGSGGSGTGGAGGMVNVYGGSVTATGDDRAAGIGGGGSGGSGTGGAGIGATVTVNGGIVIAASGEGGVGIGGGYKASGSIDHGTLTLRNNVKLYSDNSAMPNGSETPTVSSGGNVDSRYRARYMLVCGPVEYLAWDGSGGMKTEHASIYTLVTASATSWTDGGWYVAAGDVTISERVTVTGEVNLILCDGATLTASSGVNVDGSDTLNICGLNIYGQAAGSGTLKAKGADGTGSTSYGTAGIGGGSGAGGAVTIHGGTVDATGGDGPTSYSGAGIGGGGYGAGGTVTVYGGKVTAAGGTGHYGGAGIGGGGGKEQGGTVTVYGGVVTATGGDGTGGNDYAGAGIGGGGYGAGGTVTVHDGKVTAIGGKGSYVGGAGIGGGGGKEQGGAVTISGGAVTAIGGGGSSTGSNYGGMGVGAGGNSGSHGTLTLGAGVVLSGGASETELDYLGQGDGQDSGDGVVYARRNYMKAHVHSFTYSASGATITAVCDAEGCPLTNGTATLTITAPTNTTYDGTAKSAEITDDDHIRGSAEIEYFALDENGSVTGSDLGAAPVNAGSYRAKITLGGAAASVDYEIKKATLTVKPTAGQSKVYGDKDPVLTYTSEGLVNGDTISGVLSRQAGETVGTYAIQGTLTAGDNYTISFTGASFEITPKELTVTPKTGQSKVYGDKDPVLAYTYGGLLDGDSFTGALGRVEGENVGSYEINQGTLSAGNNYSIELTEKVYMQITQRPLTVTAGSDTKVYDGQDLTEDSYSVNEGGLADGDSIAGLTVTGSQNAVGESANVPDKAEIKNAKGLDVTACYNVSYENGTLEVTQRSLTIKAASAAKKDDGTALTDSGYTAEGLADGDSIESVTVTGSQTEVGKSDNVPSAAVIKNADGKDVTACYKISYVSGTLEVTEKPVYTVTFLDEDGKTVLKTVSTVEGETPDYGGTPTKAADDEYSYTFAGWTPELVPAAKDAEYTATYTATVNEYTVTFLDEDGEKIASAEYPYGTKAAEIALPEEPTKAADEDYTYAFAGWSPEITAVTGDATYKAAYTATAIEKAPEKCTITVKAAEGGSVFGGGVYTVGDDVTVTALAAEGYAFTGWTEEGKTVSTAAEYQFQAAADRTLTANFELKTFTITFADEDGTVLQSGRWAYGTTPEYKGETPTKAADENYTYEFAGWDEELVPVTGKATYTATYKATEKPTEPEPEPTPTPTPEPEPEPTPKPKPSGGRDRVRTYRVTVVETVHGEVTVSPKAPEEGDKVKITAVPDEGYEVDSVTVTDDEGEKVKVKENSDGTWTYTQPRGKTTVKVTFKKTAEPEPEFPFGDVTEDMDCYEDVYWVWQRGIMIGMSDTEFGPELSLSRDMTVTVLYRLEGEPKVEYKGVFSDVPDGKWFTAPVEWAAASGIVLGYGDGTYGRSDDVTREQLAVILWRYAVMKGYAVETAALEAPDGDTVSDWAAEAVKWAAANGILAAGEDGTVRPGEAATRAEIAKAIRAFLEKVAE